MTTTISRLVRHPLIIVTGAALFAACGDAAPVAPKAPPPARMQIAATSTEELALVVSTIRRATSRYHDLQAALDDGFVFLHGCEIRPGEGPVGAVYAHFGRVLDGVIDPTLPDALIYEPARNGRPKLVGAELAIPYTLWTGDGPPTFHGATFQREDEFGVFGLHAWVWRENPEGLFAETNPNVSCDQ